MVLGGYDGWPGVHHSDHVDTTVLPFVLVDTYGYKTKKNHSAWSSYYDDPEQGCEGAKAVLTDVDAKGDAGTGVSEEGVITVFGLAHTTPRNGHANAAAVTGRDCRKVKRKKRKKQPPLPCQRRTMVN